MKKYTFILGAYTIFNFIGSALSKSILFQKTKLESLKHLKL